MSDTTHLVVPEVIAPTVTEESYQPPHAPVVAKGPTGGRLWQRWLAFPIKFFVGVLHCTSWLLSILAVGWTYRLMRRTTTKAWYKQSDEAKSGLKFRQYAADQPALEDLAQWPNWFFKQNTLRSFRGETFDRGSQRHPVWRTAETLVHSLWQNLKTGLPAVLNTWVLTLPIGLVWLFGWDIGWEISFVKMYEVSSVGRAIAIPGILVFIGVMFYLPMAQARHASTGKWRSFYDFRLVWKVARTRWLANLWLTALYALLSVPVTVLIMGLFFIGNSNDFDALSDPERLAFLKTFFFWSCAYIFPVYVLLHCLAARIYAGGLLTLVRQGKVSVEQLGERELQTMQRLGLLVIHAEQVVPKSLGRAVIRTAGWTTGRLARTTAAIAAFLLWFAFVAQIYVGMFFYYRPFSGWLNMPLIQLPWLWEIPEFLLR